MSDETDKKNAEFECLQQVIEIGKTQHGKSRKIISLLEGKDVERNICERPDFIRINSDAQAKQGQIILGVEHFCINKQSKRKKKNNKIVSLGATTEKEIHSIYEKWHEPVLNSSEIPQGVIEDLSKLFATQLEKQAHASYHTFFEAFKYTINNHIKSVDVYYENIRKLSPPNFKVELAFLIELRADFSGLYIFDKSEIIKYEDDYVPFFNEFVEYLESVIPKNKIQYIIFCIESSISSKVKKVVAVSTKNIRKDLIRQHIRVFDYSGEDYFLTEFKALDSSTKVIPKSVVDKDKVTIYTEYLDSQLDIDNVIKATIRALKLKEQNKHVLITSPVKGAIDGIINLHRSEGKN